MRQPQLARSHGLFGLANTTAIAAHIAPQRRIDWIVYAKRPFAGPEQVLAYLSRFTHRVAISNHRLVGIEDKQAATPAILIDA